MHTRNVLQRSVRSVRNCRWQGENACLHAEIASDAPLAHERQKRVRKSSEPARERQKGSAHGGNASRPAAAAAVRQDGARAVGLGHGCDRSGTRTGSGVAATAATAAAWQATRQLTEACWCCVNATWAAPVPSSYRRAWRLPPHGHGVPLPAPHALTARVCR